VVGTDVGDIKYMVSDINKEFIVDKSNEKEFSEKLNILIGDKSLRTAIGKKNRIHCLKKFSIEDMFNNFEFLFESATDAIHN
jgi:glycosyltransferase involved in cell wall biosynthesis